MSAVTRSASASPGISLHSCVDASLFPLKSIADVVNFFKRSLEQCATLGTEPDLTLLSIVAGYIELSLTTGSAAQAAAAAAAAASAVEHAAALPTSLAGIVGSGLAAAPSTDIIVGNSVPFPVVTHEIVSGLYKKFQSILSIVEKPKSAHSRHATREVIKKVSDVIWHSLIRSSYKDRAHLQNLYSYLSGNKLDCFGVALAVVAGCQLLGYRDVHLTISEDHAWVTFGGGKRVETVEVTWHGKGSEDKRGQDIMASIGESGSWLYLGGLAVVCNRPMEVAAIVSAINISLTGSSDCVEVADLQQQLLWLLYDMGHLKKYPMALGTLGELEEISATPGRSNCEQLYREAVQAARQHYRNHHVYPYTFQGNYYYRLLKYREAFAAWANAADVIRLYTYQCRDDEEIYKELLEIANEMIPYVMKTESSGHSARSILRDSEVFSNLLRFYDGICQWEEDSLTPILHIGWAKPLVNNITKFDYDIRSQVVIKVPEDELPAQSRTPAASVETEAVGGGKMQQHNNEAKKELTNVQNSQVDGIQNNNNNNSLLKKADEKSTSDGLKKTEILTTLADLTAACGEKILNPDFLLQGGGQPFAEQKQQEQQRAQSQVQPKIKHSNNNNIDDGDAKNDDEAKRTVKRSSAENVPKVAPVETVETKATSRTKQAEEPVKATAAKTVATSSSTTTAAAAAAAVEQLTSNATSQVAAERMDEDAADDFQFMLKRPVITLYSQKMKGLRDLLLAEKLNTHAISLQVTAQSVASKKVRGIDKMGNHTTNSIYATANVAGSAHHHHHQHQHGAAAADGSAAAAAAAVNESIAASRPKRMRRE